MPGECQPWKERFTEGQAVLSFLKVKLLFLVLSLHKAYLGLMAPSKAAEAVGPSNNILDHHRYGTDQRERLISYASSCHAISAAVPSRSFVWIIDFFFLLTLQSCAFMSICAC